MKFSQALDETLTHFAITGKSLAQASGLTEQSISKFRRGERAIQVDNLERILAALPKDARNYLFFQVLIREVTMEDLAAFLHTIAQQMQSFEKPPHNEVPLKAELIAR